MKELDLFWTNKSPEPWENRYSHFVLSVLEVLGKRNWALSVTFCNDGYIQGLNRTYRQKDEPTDVLSFVEELEDRPDLLNEKDLILRLYSD